MAVAPAMTAMLIRTAIREYSIAVEPDSLFAKRFRRAFMWNPVIVCTAHRIAPRLFVIPAAATKRRNLAAGLLSNG